MDRDVECGGVSGEQRELLLDEIETLYEAGLFRQAFEVSRPLGALKSWTGSRARMWASRLASHLGAPRLSLWHVLKAIREEPESPVARCLYAWMLHSRKGPYFAWRYWQEIGEMTDAPPKIQVEWLTIAALATCSLRDFEAADYWLERSAAVEGESVWVLLTKSYLLRAQDRREEALQVVERALEARAWYRPAVQMKAALLTTLDRADEGFDFLQTAAAKLESSAIHYHLAALQYERGDFSAVAQSLQKYEEESPLLEGHVAEGFHLLRARVAYEEGDDASSIAWLNRSKCKYGKTLAARLSDPALRDRPRIVIPVGFVQQDQMTCGPATLVAICRYWNRPVEHVQVAEAICYDGTSHFAERRWAVDRGWIVHEFTVTPQAVEALIQAGAPFTLTTTQPRSAHLQAVIGFDGRRGLMVIRDPSSPVKQESVMEEFLQEYAAFGPRGMVLVPPEEASRLEGIELPDAVLWQKNHEVQAALDAHRRDEAARIVAELQAEQPDHVVTLSARRSLAHYDSDSPAELEVAEHWLRLFPDNETLKLTRLSLLMDMSRRSERLETLQRECERAEAHPAFRLQYARELVSDARRHAETAELLEKVIYEMPSDSGAYYDLASIRQSQQRNDEALELYRFAACLQERSEHYSEAWFDASIYQRKSPEALQWLRNRFDRFGKKSSWPAVTLIRALARLDRTVDAINVLEESLQKRPDDGELLLYAAWFLAISTGENTARAAELLETARGRSPQGEWLYSAARVAELTGDSPRAQQYLRQALALQPLSMNRITMLTRLTLQQEGVEAAAEQLQSMLDRFPRHQPLLEFGSAWFGDHQPERAEPLIRRLLELNPANAWAVRELAWTLINRHETEGVSELVEEALRLDPSNSSTPLLAGEFALQAGRVTEARQHFRNAVRISIDDRNAMDSLIAACESPDARREELEFIKQEMIKQVTTGMALLGYRALAAETLEEDRVLELLREALEARPDLPEAWLACVEQWVAMQQLAEARDWVARGIERFPLHLPLRLEQAEIAKLEGDVATEQAALEMALQINPTSGNAVRQLSDLYLRQQDLPNSRRVLEAAISRNPRDAVSRGWLAEVLYRQGEIEPALRELETTVELEPGYDWAWSQLGDWSRDDGQSERYLQAAQRLAERRPGEARSWIVLATAWKSEGKLEEQVAALDRALICNPRLVDAHSQRVVSLQKLNRLEEASAACHPTVFAEQPTELLVCEAWLNRKQGQIDDAYTIVRKALGKDPQNYGAWGMLGDWLETDRDFEGMLQACQHMVRIDPWNARSQCRLGEALLHNDRADEAISAFAKAIELQPYDQVPANQLFDLYEDRNDLDNAAKVLHEIEARVQTPYVLARGVRLATALYRRHETNGESSPTSPQSSPTNSTTAASSTNATVASATGATTLQQQARRYFEQLCLTRCEDSTWPISTAVEALQGVGWIRLLDEVLEQSLDHADVDPLVGKFWAQSDRAKQNVDQTISKMKELQSRGALGDKAVQGWLDVLELPDPPGPTWLERLHEGSRVLGPVEHFLETNRDWLQASDRCWGHCIYALAKMPYSRKVQPLRERWAAKWTEYSELESWELLNVVELLRCSGRDTEALRASLIAMERPEDGCTPLHRLWLAAEELLAQRPESAASYLEDLPPLDNPDFEFMRELFTGIMPLVQDPTSRGAWLSFKLHISKSISDYAPRLPVEPGRAKLLKSLIALALRLRPQWSTKLWSIKCRLHLQLGAGRGLRIC